MRLKHLSVNSLLVAALVTFAACAPSAPRGAEVAFTSHADGATILGSRTIVLEADLENALPDAEISVDSNALRATQVRTDDSLQLMVTLRDHANFVTVTVANPGQEVPAVATVNLDYPFLTLENAQAASTVIGQPTFDTDMETASDKRIISPYLRPLVANGVLYLPDYGLGRVMGYLEVPTTNDASADLVLGKQNFGDLDSTIGNATFWGPQTVETDGERLYVLDSRWNRILVFSTLATTSGVAADHVIGQPDFVTADESVSSTTFNAPESMAIADGKLIVADTGNNRVLIWDSVPTEIGTAADLVLGQADMDSGDENAGGAVAAHTLSSPADVWSDGTRLVVADAGNGRVLIWNSFPTSNNVPADLVLGKPDLVNDDPYVSAELLTYPYSVHSNGNQLFVADARDHRVLVWNSFPTINGQAADVVLGQLDFDSATSGRSATSLRFPVGVYVHGNDLFVADKDNYRYLIFRGANP